MKKKIEFFCVFKNIMKRGGMFPWKTITTINKKSFSRIFVAFIIFWNTSQYVFASQNTLQILEDEQVILERISNYWRYKIERPSQFKLCPLALLPISSLDKYVCEVLNNLKSCPQEEGDDITNERLREHLNSHLRTGNLLELEVKKGDSGADIFLIKGGNQDCIAALKIFRGSITCTKSNTLLTKIGILELANSLVALDVYQDRLNDITKGSNSNNFKMVKIISSCKEEKEDNLPFRINIIAENAPGEKFYDFLNNKYQQPQEITQALETIAKSLASFHQHFSITANKDNTEVYKEHIAAEQPKKLSDFIKNDLDELKRLSHNLKCTCSFEDYIFDVLKSFKDNNYERGPESLTLTHGDLHGGNIFYHSRDKAVTLIDYGTMMKTWREEGGPIGDPAEDVGRFIASLWTWAAENLWHHDNQDVLFNRVLEWENCFMKAYIEQFKEENFFSKVKIFRKNINFYKLRYYAFKFSRFSSEEIKGSFIRLWDSDIIRVSERG